MSCSACEIRPVGPFSSVSDELALERMLEKHPVLQAAEIPADWVSYGLTESFYKCSKCSQRWHYAQSDGPYRGIWEQD